MFYNLLFFTQQYIMDVVYISLSKSTAFLLPSVQLEHRISTLEADQQTLSLPLSPNGAPDYLTVQKTH